MTEAPTARHERDGDQAPSRGDHCTPLISNVRLPVVDTSAPSGSGITDSVYCKSNKPPS